MRRDPDPRIERIFNEAVEKPTAAEQAAFVDNACGEDAALRSAVQALLDAHHRPGAFLEVPQESAAHNPATLLAEGPGTKIGRYKLVQRVGEGGFGVVYLAEQEHPVRRQVALKIIKLGMDTTQVIARFEAERQALAMMDHPNIARVFDAAATETGRPYFVMELVRGTPITAFCDEKHLSTRRRLELFCDVCSAVQHAHTKGVIHRDLKPSNVLVGLHDQKPVAKVIDFGIAKATQARLTDRTLLTEFRQFIGTPAYMSPEQAEGHGGDVDTRTDVYGLGVLLYELLTGSSPFDENTLRGKTYEQMRRIICEVEPPRPSTRVATRADPGIRRSDARTLARTLRGDLDWVVMKCLEKEQGRRYETVQALGADVRRHLDDEPVLARPPTAAYRIGKVIRRNKPAFAAAAGILAVLAVAVTAIGIALVHARAAQDSETTHRRAAEGAERRATDATRRAMNNEQFARNQTAKARAVNAFIRNVFGAADPYNGMGRDVSVREALDGAAARLDAGALGGQPDIEAAVRMTLGTTYGNLNRLSAAEAQMRRALDLVSRAGIAPEDDAGWDDAAELIFRLANVLALEDDVRTAENLARRSLAIRRRLHGESDAGVAESLDLVAYTFQARDMVAAAATERQAVATARDLFGPDSAQVALYTYNLARKVLANGDLDEAEALFRAALRSERRRSNEHGTNFALTLVGFAQVLADRGRLAEAEEQCRNAIELLREELGPDNSAFIHNAEQLVWIKLRAARGEDEESALRRMIGEEERAGRGNRPLVPVIWHILMHHLRWEKHDLSRAAECSRREIAAWVSIAGEDSRATGAAMMDLADALRADHRTAEVVPLLRRSLTLLRKHDGSENPYTMNVVRVLAEELTEERDYPAAEPLWDELRRWAERQPVDTWVISRPNLHARITAFYDAWGQPQVAAKLRSGARPATAPAAVSPLAALDPGGTEIGSARRFTRPALLPGTLHACDFADDSSPRALAPCRDEGGGHCASGLKAGDALSFPVDIVSDEPCDFVIRYSTSRTGRLRLDIDGRGIAGPISFPATSQSSAWRNVSLEALRLPQGRRVLRVLVEDAGGSSLSLNWIRVIPHPAKSH